MSAAQELVALISGLLFLLLVWFKPTWGIVGAISAATLLDCFGIATAGDVGSASSGINLYGDDIACALLLMTGVVLFLRYPRSVCRDEVPCLLLLGLIAVAVGRGIGPFSLKQAGNSARTLFTFVPPGIATMMLRPILRLDTGRLARWLALAGSIFAAIALLRWAGILAIPEQYLILSQKELREVVRALPSDYAILIGQALIATIYLIVVDRKRGWWWWAGAAVFGGVTLALQHRSVWTATLAGIVWIALRTSRLSPVRWLTLGSVVLVGLGVLMAADPAILETAQELLRNGVTETQSTHSTWAWRVDGYAEAVDRLFASEPIDILVGPPAGSNANSGGSFASIHIHSRYVDTLAYYGFFGIVVLLVWFGMLVKRCRRRARERTKSLVIQASPAFLQAILISELIYLVPYFGGPLQGFVLGLLWIAATQAPMDTVNRRFASASPEVRRVGDAVIVPVHV